MKRPSTQQLKEELERVSERRRYTSLLKSTIGSLLVVAAVVVLIATVWMPVLEIYGSSMSPTLSEGEIVISIKGSSFTHGDLVAFYYGNKVLVKRCIAGPGDWVDIDQDGNVSVNGVLLDEPYITDKAFGDCNIELPYQVPEERYFMMGDHRSTSVDSRNTVIGCISQEQMIGKLFVRVWPLNDLKILG
ncbi:MAG: signal peptidase I [Bulleidia sp.]